MKRICLVLCLTFTTVMGNAQQPNQTFEMKPIEYVMQDDTPYGFGRSGTNGTLEDIKVYIATKIKMQSANGAQTWVCKYGANLDTLITAIKVNDFMMGERVIETFADGIRISEYIADNYTAVKKQVDDKIAMYTDKLTELRKNEPWIDKEKQKAEELAALEREQRYRLIGDIEYEFTEPIGPIQTKLITNALGAKVTYQYYVNESGYEVMHGKYSISAIYQDYKYWDGGAKGWVYYNGTETLTYHYRNGILHGKVVYQSNVKETSTFGNPRDRSNSYNFDIYKGFLTGGFNFSYNGITYTGKAVNGILEYCNYQTNDGFHGKLTSNPNSKSVSIAEINNGYRTFEFDSEIQLPSVLAPIPMFRFPLIGN